MEYILTEPCPGLGVYMQCFWKSARIFDTVHQFWLTVTLVAVVVDSKMRLKKSSLLKQFQKPVDNKWNLITA